MQNNGRGALNGVLMAYNGLQHCIPVGEQEGYVADLRNTKISGSIFASYQIIPNSPKWNDNMADWLAFWQTSL